MSVFPLMGNFQTEIRRGYIGGAGGKEHYAPVAKWPGGNAVYGILSMENVRFSVWIRSDKEQVFIRGLPQLAGVSRLPLIPDGNSTHLSRPRSSIPSCAYPVPSPACSL